MSDQKKRGEREAAEELAAVLKAELNRVDQVFDSESAPSLAQFKALAVQTEEQSRKKRRNELGLFLITALFVVSMVLWAGMEQPMVLLFIQFVSLAGGAVLLFIRPSSRGSRDRHE